MRARWVKPTVRAEIRTNAAMVPPISPFYEFILVGCLTDSSFFHRAATSSDN